MIDDELLGSDSEDSSGFPMGNLLQMLVEHGGQTSQPDDDSEPIENEADLYLASTNDAIALADYRGSLLGSVLIKDRLHKKRVVEWVQNHQEMISGDATGWHNLITQFFECGDYGSALSISRSALNRYPCDAKILADAIRSAGQLGNWEVGDSLLTKVGSSDFRAGEDWSLAVYVADYLKERARAEDSQSRERTYEEALKFLRDAKNRITTNDRLINSEAEVLIESGRVVEARDLLEDVIFMDDYNNGSLNPDRRPVPQCCITYLDEILTDSCDYDKIIGICDAGIRFAAEEKRSVSVGYFFYRKALAMDGQIIANGAGARGQGIGNQDYVRNTLRTYSLASKLTETQHYQEMCRDRFLILCAMAGIDDMDVDAYVRVKGE